MLKKSEYKYRSKCLRGKSKTKAKIVKKLESGRDEVRYATALTELDGGQKLVRFYDPSGNLIEVRTPWDKFVNRE